jgi:nucleotide-binding universal stress UspA family protein
LEKVAKHIRPSELPRILVCAETPVCATKVMPHAKALAAALGSELMLVHVVEAHEAQYMPADPVEWEFCRREAEAFVSELSKKHSSPEAAITTRVLQGRTSDQIALCVANALDDITVLCRSHVDTPGRLGQTARGVLESGVGSVMVVPCKPMRTAAPLYRRILVPLDGSSRAEASLASAIKIAREQGAEIVLVHAVPEPFLIEVGPLNKEDVDLKSRLQRRNELMALEYLARKCEQIRSGGLAASYVVLIDGDERRQLTRAILSESADLVVMTSHANGGHADTAIGDTAVYLMSHSSVPVLMLRLAHNSRSQHANDLTRANGVRQPIGGC